MKGEAWRIFGSADMPYLDQLLQPSLLTTVTNSSSAFAHLRAITALKRSKPAANQIWHVLAILSLLKMCIDYTFLESYFLQVVFSSSS